MTNNLSTCVFNVSPEFNSQSLNRNNLLKTGSKLQIYICSSKKGTYLGGVNDALLYHVDILSIHGIIAYF